MKKDAHHRIEEREQHPCTLRNQWSDRRSGFGTPQDDVADYEALDRLAAHGLRTLQVAVVAPRRLARCSPRPT